jgi:amidase
MADQALHYLSLTDLSDRLRRRELSPVEVTRAMLDRIAALDGRIGSYVTVLADRAMAQARQAETEIVAGLWRGPLHGVPIALKDLCFTSFAPTSGGMAIHADYVPNYDATIVARLERAGAITLGKLAMTEGAASVGHHPSMRIPVNPWNEPYWAGASSSGSGAATATGLCYGSIGSDTGGSIRVPASANGLTGVKPTWGRVSRHGIFALSDSMDHIGPITRTAADAAAMMATIAGHDDSDPTSLTAPVPDYLGALSQGIEGVRLGIDEAYISSDCDPVIVAVVMDAVKALAAMGARIVPITMPNPERLLAGWVPFCAVECAIAHRDTWPSRRAEYGPELNLLLDSAQKVTGETIGETNIERAKFAGALAAVFRADDMIAMPTLLGPLPLHASLEGLFAENPIGMARHMATFDMTGSPTITLHGGFDGNGLPIGFQLVGRHLSEDLLLRVGHAFQQVTDWHTRHPPV